LKEFVNVSAQRARINRWQLTPPLKQHVGRERGAGERAKLRDPLARFRDRDRLTPSGSIDHVAAFVT
jgi:hypothetical protein